VRATKESGEVMTIRRTKEPPYIEAEQEQKEREELARQVRHGPDVARENAPAKDQPAQPSSRAPSPSRGDAPHSEMKTT
jgi:hypothetical protein